MGRVLKLGARLGEGRLVGGLRLEGRGKFNLRVRELGARDDEIAVGLTAQGKRPIGPFKAGLKLRLKVAFGGKAVLRRDELVSQGRQLRRIGTRCRSGSERFLGLLELDSELA